MKKILETNRVKKTKVKKSDSHGATTFFIWELYKNYRTKMFK